MSYFLTPTTTAAPRLPAFGSGEISGPADWKPLDGEALNYVDSILTMRVTVLVCFGGAEIWI